MTPLLIVNPRAGGGRTKDSFAETRKVVEAALGGVDVAFTERPQHAIELARDAACEGRELVVATGGDGSIHEVVNGLMLAKQEGHDKTTLGVIGQGTGGDFRKTLGFEHRLDRYLQALTGGKKRPLDVGQFTYRDERDSERSAWFVNILSCGMGGLVDKYVHDTSRWAGGTLAYFIASARSLIESRIGVLRLSLELDGVAREVELSSRTIAICNGRYFGSGMKVAPMAEPDDGIFEVIDMGAASKLKFAMSSSSIYSGAHMKSPDVKHYRCDKIRVELLNTSARDVFLLDVDGEPLGRLPITVEVIPGALQVLVPP